MTDRELLELAAKAAGYEKYHSEHMGRKSFVTIHERFFNEEWGRGGTSITTMDWNPLTDDGDALRLAVKLRIDVTYNDMYVMAFPYEIDTDGEGFAEPRCVSDPYAATRRAIVRAAAEIGKTM